MNKTGKKILFCVAAVVISSLVAPFVIVQLSEPRKAMGWFLLLFLAVDPLVMIGVGILSGTQLRKLWWLPLACAAAIPLLYSAGIGGFAIGLMWYTPSYLAVGGVAMLITHGVIVWRKKAESTDK